MAAPELHSRKEQEMKYWLDTEFIESGPYKPIQLLSIGLVAEDGRMFYAESNEYVAADASQWVRENVLPHLKGDEIWDSLFGIGKKIQEFCDPEKYGKPSFWGYYADYDWVVFCQIFGSMVNLPEGFPMYCNDLKQLAMQKGNPQLPKQESTEHNALNDALWNRTAHEFLESFVTHL